MASELELTLERHVALEVGKEILCSIRGPVSSVTILRVGGQGTVIATPTKNPDKLPYCTSSFTKK